MACMSAPQALRRLDDRVLGRAREGHGVRQAVALTVRISQLVLLAFAAALLLAIVFVAAPVNEANSIVSADLALADQVAGPLRDVFAFDSRPVRAGANYGLAAVVYLALSRALGLLRR